jgi:hypothetical protein
MMNVLDKRGLQLHWTALLEAILTRGEQKEKIVTVLEGMDVTVKSRLEDRDELYMRLQTVWPKLVAPGKFQELHTKLLATDSYKSLEIIVEKLNELDVNPQVWECLATFIALCNSTPLDGDHVNAWFSEVLLSTLTMSRIAPSRDNRLEAMSGQLEALKRKMRSCAICSVGMEGIKPQGKVIRSVEVGELPDSSEEGDEFVDIDRDGQRAASVELKAKWEEIEEVEEEEKPKEKDKAIRAISPTSNMVAKSPKASPKPSPRIEKRRKRRSVSKTSSDIKDALNQLDSDVEAKAIRDLLASVEKSSK